MAKCAQYTMEELVPLFTQDAQRQVCLGLKTLHWVTQPDPIHPSFHLPLTETTVERLQFVQGKHQPNYNTNTNDKIQHVRFSHINGNAE